MQLIAEQRDAAALSRQVPCSCHKKKKKKKSFYLSSKYILHFEAFLPLGITESLTEAEKVSCSCISK